MITPSKYDSTKLLEQKQLNELQVDFEESGPPKIVDEEIAPEEPKTT